MHTRIPFARLEQVGKLLELHGSPWGNDIRNRAHRVFVRDSRDCRTRSVQSVPLGDGSCLTNAEQFGSCSLSPAGLLVFSSFPCFQPPVRSSMVGSDNPGLVPSLKSAKSMTTDRGPAR